ncbi:glycosyltransferase, partial [Candidatus Gottesmanbacteria bacterium]|nr:glycosyltransferase [Candidatus Gottesmanbacteria bacterium]
EFRKFCVKNTTHDLFLVGGDYWPDPAIEETLGTLHLENRVKKIGFVSDEELPTYYRGAVAFMTTALREGFCLPAAEAMACGCPVVAVDRGAMAEVVGEGGIVIKEAGRVKSNAGKTSGEFAAALMRMTHKKTREALAIKAIVQAKKFRWEEFAKAILDRVELHKARPSKAKAWP